MLIISSSEKSAINRITLSSCTNRATQRANAASIVIDTEIAIKRLVRSCVIATCVSTEGIIGGDNASSNAESVPQCYFSYEKRLNDAKQNKRVLFSKDSKHKSLIKMMQ